MNEREWEKTLHDEGFRNIFVWRDGPNAYYPEGTVKLAFVERAGTRDRDLSSSQAAIVTASQMRKERPRSSR